MTHQLSLMISMVLLASAAASPAHPPCKRFDEIYAGGKELCENMWDGAFKYEQDEASAYTMWFFDHENPNDQVSRQAGKLSGDHGVCHLQYYHKDTPGAEPENFTECHPWKENACCAHGVVESTQKIKEAYGSEYHWDRCGPLSPECERFFVQEACFYECDPNAGLYRKWNSTIYDARCDKYAASYDEAHATANDCKHNTWQMHQMPIKASYCDAMFNACRHDRFCASDGGSFFSCAAIYTAIDKAALQAEKHLNASQAELTILRGEVHLLRDEESKGPSAAFIAVIVATAVTVLLLVCCLAYLVRREKAGKPLFSSLLDNGDHHHGEVQGSEHQTAGRVVGATMA